MDGVLIDSWHIAAEAFRDATGRFGLYEEQLLVTFRQRMGMPLKQIRIELALPEAFDQAFLETVRGLDHKARPYPGIHALLERLTADRWSIGVVTGKDTLRAESILAATGLAAHVRALVGGDSPFQGKPSPDPIWSCENLLGGHAACAYVGDSKIDHMAALSAGRPFIQASWQDGENQEQYGDWVAHSPEAVYDLVAEAAGTVGPST